MVRPSPLPQRRVAALLLAALLVALLGSRAHAQGPDSERTKTETTPPSGPVEPAPPPPLPANSITFTQNDLIAIPDDGYIGTLDGNDAFGADAGMACYTINSAVAIPAGRTVERVTTNIGINHTWVGDLTIKLRSPAGAILTLLNRPGGVATDNGADSPVGDNSNWTGSTLTFGDGAGPEAETMGGSLTDTQAVCTNDGVCAHDPSPDTATQPPSAFSAFRGNNAAGIWTLCVGDSVAFDTGTLNSWTLNLVTRDPYTASPNAAVPDDGYVGGFGGVGQVCSIINTSSPAPTSATVLGANVIVDMNHTWVGDLTMKLRSPNGTTLTFLNRPGGTAPDDGTGAVGDSANWVPPLAFGDGYGPEAETLGNFSTDTNHVICTADNLCDYDPSPDTATQPPSAFSAFNGGNAVGNWTLCVGDSAVGDVGVLQSWTLNLVRPPTSLAVTLDTFAAHPAADHIRLAWSTANEIDNLGFTLYRSTDAALAGHPLTELIPSQAPGGAGQGYSYEWSDTSAEPGVLYHYTLEDTDTQGIRTMHPPVSAILAPPTAATLTMLGAQSAPNPLPAALLPLALVALLGLLRLRRR